MPKTLVNKEIRKKLYVVMWSNDWKSRTPWYYTGTTTPAKYFDSDV